jgi:hypothetical protein
MKTYWGRKGIAPRILNLGTRWKLVVIFTPQGKSPWYPLDRRLVFFQFPATAFDENSLISFKMEANYHFYGNEPTDKSNKWGWGALMSTKKKKEICATG